MRVLVAEDDAHLGPSLKRGLERSKYAVDLVADGQDALHMALSYDYDVIVLDVLLPGLDGFEICGRLRGAGRVTPILFLTALGGVDQRVRGLDLGADDYLTKPFAFRELEARVRALLRRETAVKTTELRFADIALDTRSHEVRRGQRSVSLTSKEYALLEYLLRHRGEVLSRTTIAEHVWDLFADHLSNVIDVYIYGLRRKLCEGGEPDIIHTLRGAGYVIKEPQT